MKSLIFPSRFRVVFVLWSVYLVTETLERLVYLLRSREQIPGGVAETLGIFWVGFLNDVVTVLFLFVPIVIYVTSVSDRVYMHPWHRWVMRGVFTFALFVIFFDDVAQWLFWDEFTARYNFIAVDYLVYTHEVLGNIRESYPLPTIFAGLVLVVLIAYRLLMRPIRWIVQPERVYKGRLQFGMVLLTLPVIAYFGVAYIRLPPFSNRISQELAGNSIYSLFSAFFSNHLDYNTFYLTEPMDDAMVQMAKESEEPFAKHQEKEGVFRYIQPVGPEQHRNVVLITVESLSAEFLGAYGDSRGLTPSLDALAKESLVFDTLFATGTRTVRGLEAITLSLPPTPGQSLVRRPDNGDLFSGGFVFKERGYDVRFLYGGYGYFDNMNTFFSGNGFSTVDRSSLAAEEIHFSNIWGVADEDLLDRVLKEGDRSYGTGKPFFHLVMTTSNHRPFTYPEGRIDIPSHSGREGGVKYTDYSLGRFFREAKSRPWFGNTVFVVIADHCASSAGKVDLTVNRHHIPLLIYAPGLVMPGRKVGIASQIDVLPTVLGLLNFSYYSKFFGRDLLATTELPNRALLGNYQKLGYLRGDRLTILAPQQGVVAFRVKLDQDDAYSVVPDREETGIAIAYYQTASFLADNGGFRWPGSK